MGDAFKDRLSQQAAETSRPDLAIQCQGRPLSSDENKLAEALMKIYGTGQHDFDEVAKALTAQGITAPISGKTDWDRALFETELKQINAQLDAAYAENGYGA